MVKKLLALIVDYRTTQEAENLSIELLGSKHFLPHDMELTVVHINNGSAGVVELSERQIKAGAQLVSTGSNLGYAGALEFAIEFMEKQSSSRYDAYWFLNSDLKTDCDCLARLAGALNLHPEVGAVGPLVLNSSNENRVWGAQGRIFPWLGTTSMGDGKTGYLPKWSYLPGCSILIRASAHREVGGLRLDYKLYYEETELCVRLQKSKWKLWLQRDAVAYHAVYSMKKGIPARHFAYYFIRNNFIFWKSNFKIPILLQLPRTIYVLCREVFLPLRRAENFSELLDRLVCGLAGLWDGVLFAQGRPPQFERRLFP